MNCYKKRITEEIERQDNQDYFKDICKTELYGLNEAEKELKIRIEEINIENQTKCYCIEIKNSPFLFFLKPDYPSFYDGFTEYRNEAGIYELGPFREKYASKDNKYHLMNSVESLQNWKIYMNSWNDKRFLIPVNFLNDLIIEMNKLVKRDPQICDIILLLRKLSFKKTIIEDKIIEEVSNLHSIFESLNSKEDKIEKNKIFTLIEKFDRLREDVYKSSMDYCYKRDHDLDITKCQNLLHQILERENKVESEN
jgi:hypothetical protein